MPTLPVLKRNTVGVRSPPPSWSQSVALFLFLSLCFLSSHFFLHVSFVPPPLLAIHYPLSSSHFALFCPPLTLNPQPSISLPLSLFLSLCSLPVVLLRGICCCREKGMSAWISTLSQRENTHTLSLSLPHAHTHTNMQVCRRRKQMVEFLSVFHTYSDYTHILYLVSMSHRYKTFLSL